MIHLHIWQLFLGIMGALSFGALLGYFAACLCMAAGKEPS